MKDNGVVNDKHIDPILDRAAKRPNEVDSARLEAIADSIKASTRPVRALPPAWTLTLGTALVAAAVAIAGAARVGFLGFEKQSTLDRALIFSMLAIFVWLASTEFVSQMIPGSRHRVTPGALLAAAIAALLAMFALLFHDYHMTQFVSLGLACLSTGLLHAVPTALICWLVLRRGFAVNSVAAGLAAGTLGGLAGLAMLELHCTDFEVLHIMVWHCAVVLVSGALGALVGWALRFLPSRNA
ncbi:MAG TPA: NrsF family protein [Candidatus Aquilonibacter sp.]|nr:NrsF family protein [Candidatus Aquilonibacter sp.]